MEEIISKLRKLKNCDRGFVIFGSSSHQYELNAPITESQLENIESKYHCRFPEEYRYFVTRIGNGGAGPFYGLFPIGMQDHGHDLSNWENGYSLIGNIAKPFQLTSAWNLPPEFFDGHPDPDANISLEEEQRICDEWDQKIEKEYFAPEIMNGAIPICHEGCALRNWLVVTGNLAGTVWQDYRANDSGISPIIDSDGQMVTFRQWYLNWLNQSLEQVHSLTAQEEKPASGKSWWKIW